MAIEQNSHIHCGLLLHNHQPVGNFPWVFQRIYEESYLPMVQALERHPTIRLSLHYTGSLLDWLIEAHPEFLARLRLLVQRNQVEIVSGGYYEPILPSIPDVDKVAQIRHLTQQLHAIFGVAATGMWMAERVWEPGLPRWLREAGIEWTILDDLHFKSAGLAENELYGYYATEDQSSALKVYATSKTLRYTIPWRPVEETIALLRSLATSDGSRIVVMGDDGEKFGSWPETQTYCWGSTQTRDTGWVEALFTALEQNSMWLHMIPLGEYARNYPALGRIYLPTSSYMEMTGWALPPQQAYTFGKLMHRLEDEKRHDELQFMHGGFWRNFLVRYPEINTQHKKMLRVHEAVYAAGARPETGLRDLWKAQANDTYWHGLFGGVYMSHVRSAVYHHLIKAENAADLTRFGTGHWQRHEYTDFDRDCHSELIIEGNLQNLYLDPARGGTLFEWDMRRSMHNLLSVMTRRPESYHQLLREQDRHQRQAHAAQRDMSQGSQDASGSPHTTVRVKEENLVQYLRYDRYRRASLIDHFLPAGVVLSDFAEMRFEELGNFIEQPYEADVQQDINGITVTMVRNGLVQRPGALPPLPVEIRKTLFIPLGEENLYLRYTLYNHGQTRLQTRFACEWNIHFLGGGGNPQAYCHIVSADTAQEAPAQSQQYSEKEIGHFDSTEEVLQARECDIGNTWIEQNMNFSLSEPATLWHFPIEAVTGSEAGFERSHQGSCFTFVWPLLLEGGQSWNMEMKCTGSL